MAKADTNQPDSILLQDLLNEVQKFQYPGLIIEAVMFRACNQDAVEVVKIWVVLLLNDIEYLDVEVFWDYSGDEWL